MSRWFDGFLGVAYRYFDLRMNVVPLFESKEEAIRLWREVIHWWPDPAIRIRFIEGTGEYWFVLGSESRKPDDNISLFKRLPLSPHYERFKRGYGEAAYLRFGQYSRKFLDDVKDSDVCNCGHPAGDHADDYSTECLEDSCRCSRFESDQVYMHRRKKTITDIMFISEDDVYKDPLAWNCINANT